MKHLFNHLPKLAAVAAIALSMSSCNRAEYAMLPKTTPYHATYHGTTKVAPAPAVAAETPVQAETSATAVEEKTALVVATAPAKLAAAPAAAKASVAATPVAAAKQTPVAAAPRKLNLTQRLALGAVTKKLDKATSKLQLKQRSETAETSKLQGKLRQGIILVLVGLLVEVLGAALSSGIIYLLGAILILVGLVLIVLYLLDEL